MQERRVEGVFRVVAKRESSFVLGLGWRELGMRVMRLGLEMREAVQGMRRKGSLLSEGAIFCESDGVGRYVVGCVFVLCGEGLLRTVVGQFAFSILLSGCSFIHCLMY